MKNILKIILLTQIAQTGCSNSHELALGNFIEKGTVFYLFGKTYWFVLKKAVPIIFAKDANWSREKLKRKIALITPETLMKRENPLKEDAVHYNTDKNQLELKEGSISISYPKNNYNEFLLAIIADKKNIDAFLAEKETWWANITAKKELVISRR
jgi:hypothetical protein